MAVKYKGQNERNMGLGDSGDFKLAGDLAFEGMDLDQLCKVCDLPLDFYHGENFKPAISFCHECSNVVHAFPCLAVGTRVCHNCSPKVASCMLLKCREQRQLTKCILP